MDCVFNSSIRVVILRCSRLGLTRTRRDDCWCWQYRRSRDTRMMLGHRVSPSSPRLVRLPARRPRYRSSLKCTMVFSPLMDGRWPELSEFLHQKECSRSTRTADQQLLQVPRSRTEIFTRAFQISAATIWNNLPLSLKLQPSLSSFKKELNTHYFNIAYCHWTWSRCLWAVRCTGTLQICLLTFLLLYSCYYLFRVAALMLLLLFFLLYI